MCCAVGKRNQNWNLFQERKLFFSSLVPLYVTYREGVDQVPAELLCQETGNATALHYLRKLGWVAKRIWKPELEKDCNITHLRWKSSHKHTVADIHTGELRLCRNLSWISTSLQWIPNSWLKKRWPSRNCRTMDSPEGRFPSWQANMSLVHLNVGHQVLHVSSPNNMIYHFHPRSSNWNKLPFLDVMLNLGEKSWVPALHPLELLGLHEKPKRTAQTCRTVVAHTKL